MVNFRSEIERLLPQLYAEARRDLRRKLELYDEADVAAPLPERHPYTLDQVLADFWPPARGE